MHPTCHMLVGPPASGKTTVAQHLKHCLPEAIVVNTDDLRRDLFGNEEIQGPWEPLEASVLQHIQIALKHGQPVIYDATNVKRSWRMDLIQKLNFPDLPWIAWVLQTPLAMCLEWNQQRQRQVPNPIIQTFYQTLHQFPVLPAEGYQSVLALHPHLETNLPQVLQRELDNLETRQRNQQNRYAHFQRHGYSQLLDFDRLMHLIQLLSHAPGLGQLATQDPQRLMCLLQTQHLPAFLEPLEEIAAVMAAQHGALYADPTHLAQDLQWLEANGFLGSPVPNRPLQLPPAPPTHPIRCHPYSDRDAFERLLNTIRYILQSPLSQEPARQAEQDRVPTPPGQIAILAHQLQAAGLVPGNPLPMLRKDIERILKPYGLFPPQPLRKGYFLGTGILDRSDLQALYELAQKQVDGLDDVLSRALVERFETRLRWAQFDLQQHYPVRAIERGSIVNVDLLSGEALSTPAQSQALEADIRHRCLIGLAYRKGAALHGDRPLQETVWPIQILFHNIAWYLGYQVASGPRKGLFCFERLDRLYRTPPKETAPPWSQQQQRQALKHLETLCQHSFGIYFGQDPAQQEAFLQATPRQRLQHMGTLKLRVTPALFRFISEATQQFPRAQVAMSRPEQRDLHGHPDLKKLYKLPRAQDPQHPFRLQVKLPAWCFEDVTLKAWVLGLGPGVKVMGPPPFQAWVLQEIQQAANLYSAPPSSAPNPSPSLPS